MNDRLSIQSYENYAAIENPRLAPSSITLPSRALGVLFAGFLAICAMKAEAQPDDWQVLFNGKGLENWETYLGPSYDTTNGRWGKVPLGLNIDPLGVFSVIEHDGGPVLRISGERFGGISTREEFYDYHLRLEFKWGTKKWVPRKSDKRDSGILYHAVGEHGADGGFWMRSQEFQVQEGDCGDYWGVAGGSFEVRAARGAASGYVFDPAGETLTFNEMSKVGRRCIRKEDAENPYGEWNQVDIYCHGRTAVHMINGRVVMVLKESGQIDNGLITPLTKGKIQIQSEGAEIYYRNIRVRKIDSIPAGITAR